MELGATILTFGSPFCTSIGTGFLPALTREKLPVTCRTFLSKLRRSSAVPITVTLTAGGSPTRTRPAGRVGWSIARRKPLLSVGFEVYATTLQSAAAKPIASNLSRRFLSRKAILPTPVLAPPHGERRPMDFGTRLEQRGEHLAQPVRVEVAQQLPLVGDGDLAQLLAQDQHHRVRLHRQAKPGAMTRPHPLADRPLLGQRQHAAGRQDLVPSHDHRAVVQR